MLSEILLNIVIALCSWRVWQWLSSEDQEAPASAQNDEPVPGEELLKKRIRNAAQRMQDEDLDFLRRMLSHRVDHLAVFTANALAASESPVAMDLLFEQMQKLDDEIEARRRTPQPEPDFYQKVIDENLMQEPPPNLLSRLHPRLQEADYRVLRSYGGFSGELHPALVAQTLETIVGNPEATAEDLYAALDSMKALPTPPESSFLRRLLQHPSSAVRQGVLALVAHFSIEEFKSQAEMEVSNSHPAVAAEALYALSVIGDHASLRRIRLATSHPSPLVRAAANWVQNTMSQRL